MPYFAKYITVDGAERLRSYKYKGTDNSILYNYVTNPIYNRIVPYLPMWLAQT